MTVLATASGVILLAVLWGLKKKNWDFGIRTIIALVFGGILGSIFKGHVEYIAMVGSIHVRLISALVIPLLFFSIISSIASLNSVKILRSIGGKSVFWLLLNTFTASVITMILSIVTGVGKGMEVTLTEDYVAKEVPSIIDTVKNMFPSNIFSHAVNNEIVPVIFFSVMIGIALVTLGTREEEAAKPFKTFIDSGAKVVFEAIGFIIELTPYAVMALIANAVSNSSMQKLIPLLLVLTVAYAACVIQAFLVEGTFLAVFAKLNPLRFFRGIWPAQTVAFTSQSSVGTIPVTVRQLMKLGVSEKIASFVAAFGANVGMPGCAGVWPTILAVFAIHALDIPYSFLQYLFLIVLTVIVSVGTVGVPGTATITATAVFAAAGLPIEIIVILTPISSIVDMARTTTNVTGAAAAAVLVAKSEGELDLALYNGEQDESVTKSAKMEAE
ncbi:MAG: dicarboxylate/amino acid:cation symporter [Lachnospiraceae bacterium]|nr:dicarboxylate/amino acid:cation symporter [Lachnospiraceae bacterium]